MQCVAFARHSHAAALVLAVAASMPLSSAVGAKAAAPARRIVSLVPSLTEDLFAIGAGSQVVASSQYTDYPAAAARLPQVASATSIDLERIVDLHPEAVVGIPAQRAQLAPLQRLGVRIVILADDSFADIFRDLAVLGQLAGRPAQAHALIASLQARTARLVRGVTADTRPRCFVVLGVAPIFTVGDRSYIGRLIALAGGRNAADDLRAAYGRYSAEVLLLHQPDVLIGDPQSGLGGVLDRAPWNRLRAVRQHRVYVLPDAAILERPGPRYNDGLAWLISRLHPHATRR